MNKQSHAGRAHSSCGARKRDHKMYHETEDSKHGRLHSTGAQMKERDKNQRGEQIKLILILDSQKPAFIIFTLL